jgi:hypothetical protein
MELVIGIIGIVIAIGTCLAGIRQGRKQERERRKHEWEMELDRRRHELASKVADEYVEMARRNFDSGPHALANLGLEQLGDDKLIREAINEMKVRTGRDPWGKYSELIADIDLVEFFKYVREHSVDLFRTSIQEIVVKIRKR